MRCRFCKQNVPKGHVCDKAPKKRCFDCGSENHFKSACTVGKACYKCGSKDHFARDCTGRPDQNLAVNTANFPTIEQSMSIPNETPSPRASSAHPPPVQSLVTEQVKAESAATETPESIENTDGHGIEVQVQVHAEEGWTLDKTTLKKNRQLAKKSLQQSSDENNNKTIKQKQTTGATPKKTRAEDEIRSEEDINEVTLHAESNDKENDTETAEQMEVVEENTDKDIPQKEHLDEELDSQEEDEDDLNQTDWLSTKSHDDSLSIISDESDDIHKHNLHLVTLGASNCKDMEMVGDDDLSIELENLCQGGLHISETHEKLDELRQEVKDTLQIVALNIGACDFPKKDQSELQELCNEYAELLAKISDTCPEANIVMSSVLPRAGDGRETVNGQIAWFNEQLLQMGEEPGFHFCNNYTFTLDRNNAVNESLYRDTDTYGIHLNTEGKRLLSTSIFEKVKEVFFRAKLMDSPECVILE